MDNFFDSILERSFEWYETQETIPEGLSFHGEESDLPLLDEIDTLILMHRDVHFSGSFTAMLEYYRNESAKGIQDEVEIERIRFLESIQKGLKRDLAPLLITGRDAERVAQAKKMYQELSRLAENDNPEGQLAAATLSERSEEELVDELLPIMRGNEKLLLSLATSDFLLDPLFPGYGTGPRIAIVLLGALCYEPAIPILFARIGQTDFRTESAIVHALHLMGEPVKKICLKKLVAKPISQDNERAAIVLAYFLPDQKIEAQAKSLLSEVDDAIFRDYLKTLINV